MQNCCNIWEVFDEENNLIKEYQHWKLLIKNRGPRTLGNSVAVLKRHILRFSDITDEEMLDFAKLVRETENALKKSFNYDKIHWLMYMTKDPHVHFHIFPRYNEDKNFGGIQWMDGLREPDPLKMEQKNLSQEQLNEIKEEIKKNFF
ncbi:HIT family protein [Patescibacteria group bacterium]|nr:MAG: HIT family protein [Patescibacteria group bacterium]